MNVKLFHNEPQLVKRMIHRRVGSQFSSSRVNGVPLQSRKLRPECEHDIDFAGAGGTFHPYRSIDLFWAPIHFEGERFATV